jgi:hypothetical protein
VYGVLLDGMILNREWIMKIVVGHFDDKLMVD